MTCKPAALWLCLPHLLVKARPWVYQTSLQRGRARPSSLVNRLSSNRVQ